MDEIRLLKIGEIECRVQSIRKTSKCIGCILLLYKDARVDMKILDETYGPMNWQRSHELINGNLFCNIEVWDESKKCWVSKQDVGVESNTEKEKGQASDSFKRAGFNWGIGRELYTAPFIWIVLNDGEYYEKDGKHYLSHNVKFDVSFIEYNSDREIIGLKIKDNHNIQRYDLRLYTNLNDTLIDDAKDIKNKFQSQKSSSNGNNGLELSQSAINDTEIDRKATKKHIDALTEKAKEKGMEGPSYWSYLKHLSDFGKISSQFAYGKDKKIQWTMKDYMEIYEDLDSNPDLGLPF